MKDFVKIACYICIWFVLLWVTVDKIVSIIYPHPSQIDTGAANSASGSQHALFVNDEYLLRKTQKPKMIIIGGSTARDAFRPDLLSPVMPQYEVHNVALTAGQNDSLREHQQILQDIWEQLDDSVRKKSVFIYAVSPTLFYPFEKREPLTQYDRTRCMMYPALYRLTPDNRATPSYPIQVTNAIKRLSRPYIGLNTLMTRFLNNGLRSFTQGASQEAIIYRPPVDYPPMQNSDEEFAITLNKLLQRTKDSGDSPERIYPSFEKLLSYANTNNIRLLFVFLPWPEWARNNVFFYHDLKAKIEHSLEDYKYDNLHYFDMSEILPAESFQDLNHLSKHGAPEFIFDFWRTFSMQKIFSNSRG